MIYDEFRNYKRENVKEDCIEFLKYCIQYNNSTKKRLSEEELSGMWKINHKDNFRKHASGTIKKFAEAKIKLKDDIIKNMQLLSTIQAFKDTEVYKAHLDDLRSMMNDLNSISVALHLVDYSLYNLDVNKRLIVIFLNETENYKKSELMKFEEVKEMNQFE